MHVYMYTHTYTKNPSYFFLGFVNPRYSAANFAIDHSWYKTCETWPQYPHCHASIQTMCTPLLTPCALFPANPEHHSVNSSFGKWLPITHWSQWLIILLSPLPPCSFIPVSNQPSFGEYEKFFFIVFFLHVYLTYLKIFKVILTLSQM